MNSNSDLDFLHFGIKSIDAQHQKFLLLLNELRMYNRNGEDNETVGAVIDELKAYTQYHFEIEKRIMTRSGFYELEEHLKQHDLFIQKIDEFKLAYKYQSAALSEQMLTFLQKWFLVHIPEWDQRYVDFIKNKKKNPI